MNVILGDQPICVAEYRKILLTGAEACEISVIPENIDRVYVCEIKDCRYKKYDVLFVAGLNGDVPFVKSDTALLQDSDIGALEPLSVKIEPKIKAVNEREKEAVALALASFDDMLFVSYSLVSASGVKTPRSEIVDQISACFSDGQKELKPFSKASFSAAKFFRDDERKDKIEAFDYLGLRPSFFSLLKDCDDFRNGMTFDVEVASSFYSALKNYGEGKFVGSADELLGKVNRKLTLKADVPPTNYFSNFNVSATVLETFYSCPYKSFLKFGVGLADSPSPDIRPFDFGNILHAVAEKFTAKISEIKTEEEAEKLCENLLAEIMQNEAYSKFAKRPDFAYSLTLVEKEAKKLCLTLFDEFKHSLFKPIGEEVWFADWGKYKPLPLKTKTPGFKLFGKADRVDKYKNFVRIVDYKSGNTDDKTKTANFYAGLNLQLYLYMNAFAVNGDLPAGAYYYPIKDNFDKEGEHRPAMLGQTLCQDEILSATDDRFFDNRQTFVVDAKIKTSKSTGDKKTGNLSDENDFASYLSYAKKMAENAVNDITDGLIVASPYAGSCERCEYKAICKYDEETGDFTRKVSGVDKNTIILAVENENGK